MFEKTRIIEIINGDSINFKDTFEEAHERWHECIKTTQQKIKEIYDHNTNKITLNGEELCIISSGLKKLIEPCPQCIKFLQSLGLKTKEDLEKEKKTIEEQI
jgi:2-hydroxy-3-keto-5-methylthiopentenyl-1-phosphate phosphatase